MFIKLQSCSVQITTRYNQLSSSPTIITTSSQQVTCFSNHSNKHNKLLLVNKLTTHSLPTAQVIQQQPYTSGQSSTKQQPDNSDQSTRRTRTALITPIHVLTEAHQPPASLFLLVIKLAHLLAELPHHSPHQVLIRKGVLRQHLVVHLPGLLAHARVEIALSHVT